MTASPYWPKLMRRPDATRYVSMTVAEFEKAVATGALPMPKRIGSVERWDRDEIDAYINGENDWRKAQPAYAA